MQRKCVCKKEHYIERSIKFVLMANEQFRELRMESDEGNCVEKFKEKDPEQYEIMKKHFEEKYKSNDTFCSECYFKRVSK